MFGQMDENTIEIDMSNRGWRQIDSTKGIDNGITWGHFVKVKNMKKRSKNCQVEYNDCLTEYPSENLPVCVELGTKDTNIQHFF